MRKYKDKLALHQNELIKVIEPRYGLLTDMWVKKLFVLEERQAILSEPSVTQRCKEMLDILPLRLDNLLAVETFEKCLVDASQRHVVNYLKTNGGHVCLLRVKERPVYRFSG